MTESKKVSMTKQYKFKEGVTCEVTESGTKPTLFLRHEDSGMGLGTLYSCELLLQEFCEPIRTKLTPMQAFERVQNGEDVYNENTGITYTRCSSRGVYYNNMSIDALLSGDWYVPEDEE